MGSASVANMASRPPSGLSFGPMPVRERKRSLLDANIAQGLDQFRQTMPGVNNAAIPPPPSSINQNGQGFSEDKHSQSQTYIKPEGLNSDQSLVGLGLGGSSESQGQADETYHRKRTKSVDMYSTNVGTLNSFSPTSGVSAAPTTSLDMTTATSVTHQGTTIQNWQPPDMALHLQVFQNHQHATGEVDSNGVPLRLHGLTRTASGPMLRHSISHDRMDPSAGGLAASQLSAAKTRLKSRGSKSITSTKSSKSKVRSLSMGDALALDAERSDSAPGSDSGSGSGPIIKDEDEEASASGESLPTLEYEGSEIHGDPTARKQKLRYEGDHYTPQWVRNAGQAKEGFCDTCVPGKWLQLKNSAFW